VYLIGLYIYSTLIYTDPYMMKEYRYVLSMTVRLVSSTLICTHPSAI
jgi:hypothetical protein